MQDANNDTLLTVNTNSITNLPSLKNSKIKNERSKSQETQCNESQPGLKRKYDTNIYVSGTHINENKIILVDKCKRIKANGTEKNIKDSCSTSTCNMPNLKNRDESSIQFLQKEIKNKNVNMNQQIKSSNFMKNNLANKSSSILPSILKATNHSLVDSKINNNQSLIPGKSKSEDVIMPDVLYNSTYKSITIGTSGTIAKVIQSPNLDDVEIKSRKRSIIAKVTI